MLYESLFPGDIYTTSNFASQADLRGILALFCPVWRYLIFNTGDRA